jgi:hypothetical protein
MVVLLVRRGLHGVLNNEFIERNFRIDSVAAMPGGRYSIYRTRRVVLVAAGCAAQRFESESVQSVRAALGDGPSLRSHGALRRLSRLHSSYS